MLWGSSRNERARSPRAPLAFIDPCLPTRAGWPPEGDDWLHEIKHDGIRLQVHVTPGRVRLLTMTGVDWTERYLRIAASTARLPGQAIIDAEGVVPGPDGIADFEAIMSRRHDGEAVAYAFDLMMLDGEDLRQLPLTERKARLQELLSAAFGTGRRKGRGTWIEPPHRPALIYSEHMSGDGPTVYSHACKLGLEGIVSKRLDSKYRSGRSKEWLKIKNPDSPAARRIEEGRPA